MKKPESLHRRLVYLVLAVVCIMLGVAGLLIPIIPGVLFLIMAVFLLNRVSRRFHRWSEAQPAIQRMNQRMAQLREVNLADKVRVAMLMGCAAVIGSVAAVYRSVRGFVPVRSR